MTKISRLSGISSLQETEVFKGKDISLMTEGELFTHLIQRQLEIKMKYRPNSNRQVLLEQLQSINYGIGINPDAKGVHGIHNFGGYDKAIQEIIAYAQHNPQAALGEGVGAIDQNAIRRACDNRIPAPESAVPWTTRQLFKLQTSSTVAYLRKIKEYHNEKLGRYGFVNACFQGDMKQAIIDEYFEKSGSALLYKVTDDKELSDRALLKKGFQGLYGNSLKSITGISDTNLNQFILNGIAEDFYGGDPVDIVKVLRDGDENVVGEPLTIATVLTIAKILAAVAGAATAVAAALSDSSDVEGWENMQQNLPTLSEITPNDNDFGNSDNDNESPAWVLPALVIGGGAVVVYSLGLFD